MSKTKTTELKSTEIHPAPLWKRCMAMLYDSFLVLAISMAYGASVTAAQALLSNNSASDYQPTVTGILFQLGWLAVILFFYCFFWLKAGQTVGMKAWRLKIISMHERPLTITQCVIRFFCSILSFALFGLGYLWSILDKEKATLHDKLSRSAVVVTPKQAGQAEKR